MSAALRKHIRTVEPQKMLEKVVSTKRAAFLKRQASAMDCKSPVPPQIEQHLALLIQRSRGYKDSVKFLEGKGQMEATV